MVVVKAKVSQVKVEDLFDDEFEDWTDNDEDDGEDKKMCCWEPWAGMLLLRLINKCSF